MTLRNWLTVRHETLANASVRTLTLILLAACVFSISRADLAFREFPSIPLVASPVIVTCAQAVFFVGAALCYLGWAARYLLTSQQASNLGRVAMLGGGLASTASAFISDQHSLQPWAWQAFLIFTIDALFDNEFERAEWWQRLACSVYLFSALSKFDVAFFDHLGRMILTEGLIPAVGLSAALWTEEFTRLAVAVLPSVELAAAACLFFTRSRRIGLWLATIVHAGLLLALGPLGLDHHAGVLIWNVFFVVHIWLLFAVADSATEAPIAADDNTMPAPSRSSRQTSEDRIRAGDSSRIRSAIVASLLLLPVGEPFGLFDHWPGWSVYSNRSPIVRLEVNFPQVVDGVDWISDPLPLTDTQIVSLSGWAFATWRTPSYPQERFQLGVSRELLSKLPRDTEFTLRVLTYSDDRLGRPTETTYTSIEALNARLGEFTLPTRAVRDWQLPDAIAATLEGPSAHD